MEQVLATTETESELFRPNARFLVSLHGTFTGDTFVYCVPAEKFVAAADRTDNWIKMHDDPLTTSDPSRELGLWRRVYLPDTCRECWGVGGLDAQCAARFGVSGINHVISSG